mgnify:FL=1
MFFNWVNCRGYNILNMIDIFLNTPIELQSLVLFGLISCAWFTLKDPE